MNIIQALDDPRFFKGLFKDPSTWASWRTFLKALFAQPIEDKKERKLLRKCTGLKRLPSKPARECYVIAGRRSGKSFISAIIAVFLACFFDWTPFLAPGERGSIFIIATDKEQARIIKGYVSAILNISPHFQAMVRKDLVWEIELTNNIVIAIKTASFKAVRGFTLLVVIAEELAFWRDSETSANPAQEILTALRPALSTIPNSLLLGISTPYSRSGILWEMYREHFGENNRNAPLIWQAETKLMNPTIDEGEIKRHLREDKSAARSEWYAEFRDDVEAFLPLELIESAIIPNRIELPPISDIKYFGFADSSGGRRDSFTLGIAHMDSRTKKVILDVLREARPPFVPSQVVQDFSHTLKRYGIGVIKGDKYSGEWVASAFREHGIIYENSEQTTSELYLSFLPLISNNSIELLDNKRLVSQLRGLERKTRSGGRDLVTHYPGGYDDVANAAVGSIILAQSQAADQEYSDILEETVRRHHESEFEDGLTDQEKLDRRFMRWLAGGELEPPDDLKQPVSPSADLRIDRGEEFIEVLRYGGKNGK